MEYVGCINDTNCYEKIIKDNNFSKLNESLFQNLIKTMNDDSANYFYIIIIIYTSSISVSCLLYFLFTLIFTGNKEKKKSRATLIKFVKYADIPFIHKIEY